METHRTARLGDVCALRIGYTMRGRVERVVEAGVRMVQMRDVPPNGAVDPACLERLALARVPGRHLVTEGDVLFRSRGESNTATALDARFREPVLAVAPLYVLRPEREVVLPEFLAWAINQPRSQRHFDRFARGTNMRMIPRDVLADLRIGIPDLAVQRRIVALDSLSRRERRLSVRVAEQRRRLMARLLGRAASQHASGLPVAERFGLYSGHISDSPRTATARRSPDGPADID